MELKTVQTQATSSFLQRMGFNQNFPRAVVFGPISMGGLEFRDLYVEQGVARILLLLSHVYHRSMAGKMMRIAIDTLQMEAGTSELLLQETQPDLQYVTPCWITHTRDFLRDHQMHLTLASQWNFTLACIHDEFLMDKFRTSGRFSAIELRHLAKCG